MNYYLANPIAKTGLDRLPASYTRTENMEEAELILVRSFSLHETEFSNALLAIGRAGAGVNNIPIDRAAEQGIVVFNSPGANSNAVKELTLLGLLLASRDAKGGMAWVEENKGDETISKTMEKAKSKFAGHEVAGKTLGIIGLGAIGYKLANAALHLGMQVVGYDPFLSVGAALKLDPGVKVVQDVQEIYRNADYISLHVPETKDTKGMIGREALAAMKQGAALLNFARAGLVDEEALKEALESGALRKYVTDVPSYVTANLPNVIAFPHLGASTEEAEDASAVMAALELTDYLENGNIVNSVNFPSVNLGAKSGIRVSVLFKDGAEVPEKAAAILAPFGIVKSEAKTKNGYGAALYELSKEPDKEKLASLANVLRLRVIC